MNNDYITITFRYNVNGSPPFVRVDFAKRRKEHLYRTVNKKLKGSD